ncbi:MAG: cell division protein FtsL [Clostridia bacterium]|nr:cell division protein FtsL [Clostridia bacterium]
MAIRNYQYETSPRKLEPYKETSKKRKKVNKKNTTKSKKQIKKQKAKETLKNKIFITLNCVFILGVLFAVIWRNSLISQSFSQIQILKSEIAEIQKENDQLEISIQNSLNLSNIEQEAKEKLGMQKLTSKQTIYLNFPKKDYVEPSTEEVVIEENIGIWQTIINFFNNIF